jgi:hypothetical protein
VRIWSPRRLPWYFEWALNLAAADRGTPQNSYSQTSILRGGRGYQILKNNPRITEVRVVRRSIKVSHLILAWKKQMSFCYLFESFESSCPNEQPHGHDIFVDLGPWMRSTNVTNTSINSTQIGLLAYYLCFTLLPFISMLMPILRWPNLPSHLSFYLLLSKCTESKLLQITLINPSTKQRVLIQILSAS